VVYDPVIKGRRHWFGVTGRLYKHNLLFYDRETDSLWSQLLSQAVTGPLAGTRLSLFAAENTTWVAWKAEHPETLVLSVPAEHAFEYTQDPYADYPLVRTPALLVTTAGAAKIYPFSELRKQPKGSSARIDDRVGGRAVTIIYDRFSDSARVETDTRSTITSVQAFLGELEAFYPQAVIYRGPAEVK